MIMNYEEELRLLEEWIEIPKGGEDCITVVDTKHPRMLNCSMVREEIDGQDLVLSCKYGILLYT
jgi:hypothetical protein